MTPSDHHYTLSLTAGVENGNKPTGSSVPKPMCSGSFSLSSSLGAGNSGIAAGELEVMMGVGEFIRGMMGAGEFDDMMGAGELDARMGAGELTRGMMGAGELEIRMGAGEFDDMMGAGELDATIGAGRASTLETNRGTGATSFTAGAATMGCGRPTGTSGNTRLRFTSSSSTARSRFSRIGLFGFSSYTMVGLREWSFASRCVRCATNLRWVVISTHHRLPAIRPSISSSENSSSRNQLAL